MTEQQTTQKGTGKTDSGSYHASLKKTPETQPTSGLKNHLPNQKNNDPLYKIKKKSERVVGNVRKDFNMSIGTNPYDRQKIEDSFGKVYAQPYQENEIQKQTKQRLGDK